MKQAPSDSRPISPSAQAFLDHLGLPLVHPLCDNDDGNSDINVVHEELSYVGHGVFEVPGAVLNTANINTTLQHTTQQQSPPQLNIPPPIIGPISSLDLHDGSIYQLLLTATTMTAPTLAMGELWVRLFAFFLGPLCLAWVIHHEIRSSLMMGRTNCDDNKMDVELDDKGFVGDYKTMTIHVIGVACSAVLFTDSLYVYEYGRTFGFSLFVVSCILAIRCGCELTMKNQRIQHDNNSQRGGISRQKTTLYWGAILSLISTTIIVYLRSDGGHSLEATIGRFLPIMTNQVSAETSTIDKSDSNYNPLTHLSDPGIDLPTIDEGLYYSPSNALVSAIASHWPESSRTYSVDNGATPYLINGDQRTGIPFLVNKVEDQEYIRVFVQNPFDEEYLALDIAFPFAGYETIMKTNDKGEHVFVHDSDKPVYLVLHGLNGGSHEEYVKDFVKRRRSEGSTVVVLIARGMMDTTVRGWNVFHGARTGDVDIASRALVRGLDSLATAQERPRRQILVGVGYSMGGQ
jgi:hypothetical protein